MPRELRSVLLALGLALALGPSVVAAEAEAKESQEILAFEPNLALWSLVVFGLLFAILYRYAWGPLAKALDEREAKMRASYEEAQKAQAEARAAQADYEARIKETGAQVAELLAEARRDAEATKAQIVQQANVEAVEIKDRAVAAIKLAESQALENLFDQAAQLATLTAARVVPRELTDEDHRRLVALALEEIPRVKAGKGARR